MPNDSDILLLGLVGTLILLFLASILIASIVIAQNRRRRHEREVEEIAFKHEMEVATAKLEATQNIMLDIGRELHDNVGQLLTASQLGMMRMQEEEHSSDQLTVMVQYLEEAIAEVNRLGRTLNVDHWRKKSLFEAIVEQSARLERLGFAQVLVESNVKDDKLEDDERTVMYRLFQEVIQNTLKHSQASEIMIKLNDEPFHMELKDNGNGFNSNSRRKGTGLNNILKRSELIGMQAILESSPGNGTAWTFRRKKEKNGN